MDTPYARTAYVSMSQDSRPLWMELVNNSLYPGKKPGNTRLK